LTIDRRASSWGQGDQPIEFADVLNFQSIRDERAERPLTSAGYSFPRSEQSSSFAPRTPSGLSNIAATSPSKEHVFDDDDQQFGPAYFDEDSSTIASAYGNDGEWHNGSEEEGDDDSDEEDHVVTFLPRRRQDSAV
jgi:[calcium/calmodulin-dependent protein kinase] kinase